MLFHYQLAEELGMSVEYVLNNISTLEISGWAKYFVWKAEQQKRK